MTRIRSGLIWPSEPMVSSVRPSLKYSCSGSVLKFRKGRNGYHHPTPMLLAQRL